MTSLNENTTYYTYERTPDLYINGGTAFSDGNNEYVDCKIKDKNLILDVIEIIIEHKLPLNRPQYIS